MKNYNDEYFFLGLAENSSCPILNLYDDFNGYAIDFLRAEPIEYSETIQLKFISPAPQKPKMVDYHHFKMPSPVLSEKLKKVIEDIGAKNVQFVPVLIRDKGDQFIKGYHVIKVYNRINCADLEKSKYDLLRNGAIGNFKKLILDNEKLDEIPLEDRLIFAVGEKTTYVVYHISVIEKMLASEPEGMTVYRLSGWDPSVPFQEIYGEYLKSLGK